MLEGSDCLKCFEGVKLNDARMQVERYLDEAIASREAIRLIDAGEEGVYITSKLEKLMVSGYLYKKSLVWITLLTIAFTISCTRQALRSGKCGWQARLMTAPRKA